MSLLCCCHSNMCTSFKTRALTLPIAISNLITAILRASIAVAKLSSLPSLSPFVFANVFTHI